MELAQYLIASAEKVKQYDQATGDPVQRVVFYFIEAIRKKIGRETGTIASQGLKDEERYQLKFLKELL